MFVKSRDGSKPPTGSWTQSEFHTVGAATETARLTGCAVAQALC